MADLLAPFAGRRSEAVAERLIAHYGSLGRALLAPPQSLTAALADHPALARRLLAARRLFEAGLHEQVSRSRISAEDPAYRRYLRFQIGQSPVELLHATFVTADWGYLADDRIATGSVAQVDPSLRALLGRAFDVGAHGILLAHNHPSGSPEPSANDIRLTRKISELTKSVGIEVLDHLVVGADRIVSMRERGLL